MTRTGPSPTRTGPDSGPSTAGLLATYGHPAPALPPVETPPAAPPGRSERVSVRRSRRGRWGRGLGWNAVPAPLTTLRTTTDQIGGYYSLLSSPGLPPVGAQMGYDLLSGGAFYCHPPAWVLRKIASNPNMILFGEPGMGKSSTIVAFFLRMMLYGVKTLIAGDTKGEYTPVVEALGYRPIRLGYGQGTRINPLDLGPLAARWTGLSREQGQDALNDLVGRWEPLLFALCQAQGYDMTPTDTVVVSDVLRRLTGIRDGDRLRPVTIPALHRGLAAAEDDLVRTHRFADRQHFLDVLRPVTDTLGAVVEGPLKGLFDAETTVEVDWTAPIASLDLKGLTSRGEKAVAVAMTCLGSWSRSATELRRAGELRIIVRDEMWRQMRLGAGMVAAIDAELRLSRDEQIISVLAAHKPGDLESVGAAGSQEVAIAKDLLALCDTRVLMGQTTDISDALADELGLTGSEWELIAGWCNKNNARGRALWKIKQAGYKVQTVLSAAEMAVFDTNSGLKPETQPDDSEDSAAAPADNGRVRS